MTYYRNLSLPLDTNPPIPNGAVFPESLLSPRAIVILETKGKIAPVSTPPLSAIPGWTARAKKLEGKKIAKPEQFLEAPSDEMATLFSVTSRTVERWKLELLGWIESPDTRKSG